MPTRILTSEYWIKRGQPDVGSKFRYFDKTLNKYVNGKVTMCNYGHKKGVELRITSKFKA